MTRRKKKFLCIFIPIAAYLIFSIIYLFVIFGLSINKYIKNKPNSYYNVKWTCSEPEIVITITSKSDYQYNDDGNHPRRKGYMMVGEQKVEIYWQLGHSNKRFYIYRLENDETLMMGYYTFDSKSGILTATVSYDYIFDGQYSTLTFKKVKLD